MAGAAAAGAAPAWIAQLEAHFKSAPAATGFTTGFLGFKMSLIRRNPNGRGAGYRGISMSLHDWYLQARIGDIFPAGSGQAYVIYELLDPTDDPFKDFCVQCGTKFDDPQWNDNLDGLYVHLGQQHALDLAYEYTLLPPAPVVVPPPAYVATPESHPGGLDPWVADMGKQRVHYSLMPRAGVAAPLPAEASSILNVSLLRFVKANSGTPGFGNWKGLSASDEDIMVTATVAGCPPGMNPTSPNALQLEGFELPKPCRKFILGFDEWSAIPVVASPAEAWALRDAGPAFEWCSLGHTGVVLDDHTTWSGNAFNRRGESVLSGAEFAAGAKPNFDELLRMLGHDKKDSLVKRKLAVAEGLAALSAEAAFNMATASKGKSHSAIKQLKLIPKEELSALLNPMTGGSFPPLASAAEKLQLVSQATGQAMQGTFDCDVNWWCLICNGNNIAKAAVGEFSVSDLENGKFELTDNVKAAIVTLAPGQVSCSIHSSVAGSKGRGFSYPPRREGYPALPQSASASSTPCHDTSRRVMTNVALSLGGCATTAGIQKGSLGVCSPSLVTVMRCASGTSVWPRGTRSSKETGNDASSLWLIFA